MKITKTSHKRNILMSVTWCLRLNGLPLKGGPLSLVTPWQQLLMRERLASRLFPERGWQNNWNYWNTSNNGIADENNMRLFYNFRAIFCDKAVYFYSNTNKSTFTSYFPLTESIFHPRYGVLTMYRSLKCIYRRKCYFALGYFNLLATKYDNKMG